MKLARPADTLARDYPAWLDALPPDAA